MNEKLVLQDLVDLLSKKAKITKKEADSFFRELFQLILERIFDNDQVKIKDFGTFRLVFVNNRESVNVNTGEKIEIPAHYKLSFLPDKILKNQVNKPFGQFETILLEDGVIFDGLPLDSTQNEEDEDVSEDIVLDNVVETTALQNNVAAQVSATSTSSAEVGENAETFEEMQVIASDVEQTKASDKEQPIIKHKQVTTPIAQSFVYTYTSSTSSTNDANSTITISLPKDDFSKPTAVSEKSIESNAKETLVNETNLPSALIPEKEINENSLVEEENMPLPRRGVSDYHIESIKPLSNLVVEIAEEEDPIFEELDDEDYDDYDEEEEDDYEDDEEEEEDYEEEDDEVFDLETEIEDDIDPVFHVLKPEVKEKSKSIEEQNIIVESSTEATNHYSSDDPERPLIPFENVVDDSQIVFQPVETKKTAIEQHTEKPLVESNVANKADVAYDDVDDMYIPSYDYEKGSRQSKLKTRLFIALVIFAIISFAGYQFYKLLNSNPTPKIYKPRQELTLMDTLILMQDSDQPGMSLDSIQKRATLGKKPIIDEQVSVENPVKKEIQVLSENKSEENNLEDTPHVAVDSAAMTLPKRVLSDRLHIGIVNKGADHLAKYPRAQVISSNEKPSDMAKKETLKPTKGRYITFKKGNTLMILAATYYGNKVYWVYIYQANKANISNPNEVPLGMSVLIPSLDNYGITNPHDIRSLSKAKELESTIFKRRRY